MSYPCTSGDAVGRHKCQRVRDSPMIDPLLGCKGSVGGNLKLGGPIMFASWIQ